MALLICVTNFNVTFNAIFNTIFDTIFVTISNTNQDHRRCMASAIAWGGISFVHWVQRRLLIKVSKVSKLIKLIKLIKLNKAIKANYMQPTYR
jgi:hypothetical protein